uniref:Uncharacterized protein n=1 Tax=Arundo donax TaxID=35708 RepID=A0A0A8XZK0_ARUDO
MDSRFCGKATVFGSSHVYPVVNIATKVDLLLVKIFF